MTTTITSPDAVTTPTLVLGYRASRDVPTVLHRIIGRGDPDVTLVDAGLRTGTLELFYPLDVDALAAEAMLTVPGVFTLTDTLTPSMGMLFVVSGVLVVALDQDTGRWTLSVPYGEVAP